MVTLRRLLVLIVFTIFPTSLLGAEGYSSPALSMPASIHYRAFTIYTHQEACENAPVIATIDLKIPSETLFVGEKLHLTDTANRINPNLVIEAFDEEGNFVASVPVSIDVHSVGRTADFDPGVIYTNASIEYWEARKPGKFAVFVRWGCAEPGSGGVWDEKTITVIDPEN